MLAGITSRLRFDLIIGVLPSFRFPITACFFRKSLQSFLLRPNASMLWVKVLKGGERNRYDVWILMENKLLMVLTVETNYSF